MVTVIWNVALIYMARTVRMMSELVWTMKRHIISLHPSGERGDVLMETVAGNPFDSDVEGIIVFRAFVWPFETFMSEHMVDLVEEVYNGKGLVRRVCNHQGSFYMNGKRQTSQASSTMTALSQNKGQTISITIQPPLMYLTYR